MGFTASNHGVCGVEEYLSFWQKKCSQKDLPLAPFLRRLFEVIVVLCGEFLEFGVGCVADIDMHPGGSGFVVLKADGVGARVDVGANPVADVGGCHLARGEVDGLSAGMGRAVYLAVLSLVGHYLAGVLTVSSLLEVGGVGYQRDVETLAEPYNHVEEAGVEEGPCLKTKFFSHLSADEFVDGEVVLYGMCHNNTILLQRYNIFSNW